jgi:hypothetical protein
MKTAAPFTEPAPVPPDRHRRNVVQACVTDEEQRIIRALSRSRGVSVSRFIRTAVQRELARGGRLPA